MKKKPVTPGGADRLREDTAHVAVVNRTHRIIREQALSMQEQRNRRRELWIPLSISSAVLLVLCYAMWGLLASYDLTPTGIPDASDQVMLYLLLWSLPVAAAVLGLFWFRHGGQHGSTGGS